MALNLGEVKTGGERTLYSGFLNIERILAINPTKEERAEIYGYELKSDAKDNVYEGKTAKGDEYIDIVFILKGQAPHEQIFDYRIRLVDKDMVSQEGKTQYVNQVGSSSWIDSEKNLLEKFTKCQNKEGRNVSDREFRKAIQGEANLYTLLQAWMDKGVSFFGESSAEVNILIDKKRAFRNIDKFVDSDLRPYIGDTVRTGTFYGLAVVGIGEKDGKVTHHQNIHSDFWPQWKFKNVMGAVNTGDWTINDNTKRMKENLEKSLKKSAYTLGWLKEWNANAPDTPLNATDTTFREPAASSNESLY
jgi:hypothetical protein